MAEKKFKIPKRDAERALKVLEYENRAEKKYHPRGGAGSCLAFVLALAVAGAIIFYIFTHRVEAGRFWQRSMHPDTPPAETGPDPGY
jgi:hypothetical protein